MNRDKLAAQANAHLHEQKVRELQALENGRRFERERIRRVDNRMFFTLMVAASTIGCGIVLAVAIGLSKLY